MEKCSGRVSMNLLTVTQLVRGRARKQTEAVRFLGSNII